MHSALASPYNSPHLGRSLTGEFGHFSSPFLDMASLAMPEQNKNALDWCFVPGTLVELADHSEKPIEAVDPGDVVLTQEGTYERVKHAGNRHFCGDLVEASFCGLTGARPLRMTPEHKVQVSRTQTLRGSRAIDEVLNGDYTVEEIPAAELRPGDYIATPLPYADGPEAYSNALAASPEQPRFSGWLLGIYAAEGCPIRDKHGRSIGVRLSLGEEDERNGVLARLARELSNAVDIEAAVYTPALHPSSRLVSFHEPELVEWLLEHCPGKAETKRIHGAVWLYGADFSLDLLAGWVDGDGNRGRLRHKEKPDRLRGGTASAVLFHQLMRLGHLASIAANGFVRRARPERRGRVDAEYGNILGKHPEHIVEFRTCQVSLFVGRSEKASRIAAEFGLDRLKNVQRNGGNFIYDNCVFRRVYRVSRVPYDGPVFNLEVENHHSYIANGVAVRNCAYIYDSQETYRQAMERKFAYFITDVEISSADPRNQLGEDERKKWITFLRDTLGVTALLKEAGNSREAYGNCFASVVIPFKRFLVCPRCHTHYLLREVYERPDFDFRWQLPDFIATCPNCKTGSGYRGPWLVNDMPEDLESKLHVKLWAPKEIEILHDLYTDDCAYIWRVPEDYKKQLKAGHLFHLERVSLQVLKAVQNNNLFRFNPGVIHHMKVPVLSGRRARGWGFSPILTNFRQIWYVQVLRRYNEAIGLDYIIPFRVITPEVRSGAGSLQGGALADPLQSLNMADFGSEVMRMLRRRRRDPAGWNFLPFPVKYQALGGDAKALAPAELLDQAYDVMLNGAGTFAELYRGTLQMQTAPAALRLYEAVNAPIVHDFNRFLQWLVDECAQILSWEKISAKLRRVTHADDFNKQMAQLQLMMGQAISQTSGLRAIGMNWDDEQRQIAEEARRQSEMQAEIQEEMDQAAFGEQIAKGMAPGAGGGMAAGGALGGTAGGDPAAGGQIDPATGQPAPAGPVTGMIAGSGMPQSMDDLLNTAAALAEQLLGLPESQKDSELRLLKQRNEVLHSLVRSHMEQKRNRARTAGGAMLLGQQPAMPAA